MQFRVIDEILLLWFGAYFKEVNIILGTVNDMCIFVGNFLYNCFVVVFSVPKL